MNIISGNIFTTSCQTIVNTVNCFGVMGAGIALECRYRYPDLFDRYKSLCDRKLLSIGQLYLYKTQDRWILNFPTKYHWKFESKPEYIEKGLQKFSSFYSMKGIQSVAFPLLGAHNGGLSKEQSIGLLEKYLRNIPIPVEIYEYDPTVPDDIFPAFKKQLFMLSESILAKSLQLPMSKIKKLKEMLDEEDINNMSSLANLKGVGESTIQKCFLFAARPEYSDVQLDLF